MMTDNIAELAARCTVAIYCGRRFLGSGFLAAPGQVLTCAHVAAEGGPGPLTVCWAGRELTARQMQLIPPQAEPGRRTYDPPDVALITIDLQPEQPFAWLADRGPDVGSDVLCLGYSEVTTETGVAADSVLVRVAAASGAGFVKVQQGEIPRGMSGSLALDLGTHRVCGLVKTSRDIAAPRGGWIIPVSAIAGHLGAVVEQNMAGHDPSSPWRHLATRHAEFTHRLFRSRSPLQVSASRSNAPPSWWLDPRHRATEFQERPELESLLAWASDEDPATPVARLVVGEGGSGKTRLAIELAARLSARGWIAGILTADDLDRLSGIAEALHEILAYGHRVFIVLDYPEGMGDELTRFLAQLPLPDEGIVRILLLARFGGGWWDTLHPAGDIKFLIDHEPIRLTPLCPDPGVATHRFSEALRDYRLKVLRPDAADAGASAGTPLPPTLAEAAQQHSSAIRLHALALVSALHERDHGTLPHGEAAWADPLESLVNHERKHWAKAARGRVLACAHENDAGWAGRILLVPTLLAVYRCEEANAAVSRIPEFAERFPGEAPEATALLRDLYPPDEAASLRWWSPLPLDRLGETLLAAVLKSFAGEEAAVEYVAALLRGASLPEAVQGVTVMTRLSADPETTGTVRARLSRCLDMLASADGSRLLPALLVADRQVPPGVQRPGERQLALLHPASAMGLVQLLNLKSVPRLLQETGLTLLDHAERVLDTDDDRFKGVPGPVREMTVRMRDLGIDVPVEGVIHIVARALRAELLMRLGRVGDAIGPAEAAARAMRAIERASSRQEPLYDGGLLVTGSDESGYDYSKPLLKVLDVYAEALQTVGRLAESAEVRQEGAAIAQHGAGRGDPDSERALVTRLCELAEVLLQLGQPEQAERWARNAAERARALPDLAQAAAFATWAKTLDRAGMTADAQAVAGHTVRILQQDAGTKVDRVLAARVMRDLGHLAPAGAAATDVLAELRNAVARDPATALSAFFSALEHAENLARNGDLEGASSHLSEALRQARRLAADDPDTNMRVLAYGLMHSAETVYSPDPAAEIAEAVRIYRLMVDEWHRDDMRADLALALIQHALMLRDAGRDTDSLPGFAEAIELLRPLLAEDRWRNTPYLCMALALFAETNTMHGDPDQAVAAAREAIDLEISRTDDLPPTPAERLPQFRHILFLALARILSERAAQSADPAVIAAITTEIREIARTLPAGRLTDGDRMILAGVLGILGTSYIGSGHLEDAVPSLTEALGILRSTADTHPDEPDPQLLFRIGKDLLSVYRTLGQHADAARAAAEVLADCQRTQPLEEQQRYECVVIAADIIAELPRPPYAAEALRLATALARTCREWLPRDDLAQVLPTAAVIELSHHLAEATIGGVAPDDWPAAVLEVSAGAAILAAQPYLLRAKHVQAVAQAASVLADAGQLDEALDLNTRAVELHQSLAASHDDLDPLPGKVSLVQRGVFLSAQGRLGDAIGPLEQALPVLLAFGEDIPRPQWMLLLSTVDLLRQAYRDLSRDDAEQSLIDAVNASGIPLEISTDQPVGKTGNDLHSTLQAARADATTDPERAIAVFRELLLSPAGVSEYLIARAACGQTAAALGSACRFPAALRLCDLLITSGSDVGLSDWARIEGKSRQLDLQLDAGRDPQAVLTEAAALTARVDELTGESGAWKGPDLRWPQETLLWVSARAALLLSLWPDVLRFTQEETNSMRERGAPLPEVAFAEFKSFSALVGMGRTAEAQELLDRCETVFRQVHEKKDFRLGLVTGARATLAANAGDPARAIRLQSEALGLLYQSRDVRQIQRGHAALGIWHAQADLHSPLALAHALAAAMLAEISGQFPDVRAITRALFLRADEYPATAAMLCAGMDETSGPRFTTLLHSLSQGPAAPAPGEVMAGLVRQARDSQPYLFEKLAEHRMRWDPVFAAIAAARQGDLAAARAVKDTLGDYVEDTDWSQLSLALGHLFHQRPEAASAVALDEIDAILLRRCTDALDGIVLISPSLAYAMPLNNVLAEVLFSAQNGQTSPALARVLEDLARKRQLQPLVTVIHKILAGERDPRMTSGLDQANAAIVTTLLGHLSTP
jgi:tetratricopeptide (TPR) repeat protein